MFFRETLERFAMDFDLSGRLAAGDGPRVWGAHHNSLEHGLAADQGFLAALKRRQKLNRNEKTPPCLQKVHADWMIFPAVE
jgi:hypothetical protein